MRHHLLTTFNKIYILNLHGNSSRKKEKTNDDKEDKNVFDIKTGVSISFFIKHKERAKKNELAKVYYSSLKGEREKNIIF